MSQNPHVVAAERIAGAAKKKEQAAAGIARAFKKDDQAQKELDAAITAQKALMVRETLGDA